MTDPLPPSGTPDSPDPLTFQWGREDDLGIAKSDGAGLSRQEKFVLFEHIHTHMSKSQPTPDPQGRNHPLFFGTWSGMNPFRYVKPFFLSKDRNKHSR